MVLFSSRGASTRCEETIVAQDKKTDPGHSPGKDLVSKIAKAYRNMPLEPREQPKLDQHDVQNPELDQAFDRMVQMYKGQTPEKEEPVVTLPIPPAMNIPRPGATEQVEEYECRQCGHKNPVGKQFCGRCGVAREGGAAPRPRLRVEPSRPKPLLPHPVKVKQVHAQRRDRTNPYLLLAVVLLLGVIAWQQWGVHPPSADRPVAAPAQHGPAPPPFPTPSPPRPDQVQVSPTAVPAQQSSAKPPKKPAGRPSATRPSAAIQRAASGQSPLPSAPATSGPPIAPYQSLTDRPMPVLPSFASRPPKPESAQQLR